MAKVKLELDHKGMKQVLNSSEIRSAVAAAGDRTASHCHPTASGKPLPVDSRTYTTTVNGTARPAAVVTIKHAAGAKVEAKRGHLAKAAAAAGLEVHAKGGRD